jgi:hypothetical protein
MCRGRVRGKAKLYCEGCGKSYQETRIGKERKRLRKEGVFCGECMEIGEKGISMAIKK